MCGRDSTCEIPSAGLSGNVCRAEVSKVKNTKATAQDHCEVVLENVWEFSGCSHVDFRSSRKPIRANSELEISIVNLALKKSGMANASGCLKHFPAQLEHN